MSLLDQLQAEMKRLGFSLFGVAPIAPPEHLRSYLEWIAAGRHAQMHYLAAEPGLARRANPALILPEARSMLVVGMPYANPNLLLPPVEADGLGRVAAYAWGADYHEVIPPLLEQLVAYIQEKTGGTVRARIYTDTGPILEHDAAQTAGLGWIGKNTCLISPHAGSFFLLGEVLLDVELPISTPMRSDHCGSCQRCIQSCPTQAIRADRTIEAERCISYQTIENKSTIPPELRPQMGDWVFGCDICQMVCPWNIRFATSEGHPALAANPLIARPLLRDEIALSPVAFREKFRHSPVQRAKRRGYLRNVAVALGNQADPDTTACLNQVMQNEPEALVRAHTAWALGRIATPSARQALADAQTRETESSVLEEIRAALGD